VLGGLLLGAFSWSSIFWVNGLIGGVGLILALVGVTNSRDPAERPLDWIGAVLVSGAMFLLTFGLIESNDSPWLSPTVIGSLVGSAVLWALFLVREARTAFPLVPLALFRIRSFTTANVIFVLLYLSLTGMFFYVTLFFQNLLGWSALTTGLSWIFLNFLFLVASVNAGRVTGRFGMRRVIAVGCAVAALGMFGLALISPTTPFAVTASLYMALGLGYSLAVPAVSSVAMGDVPVARAGGGSGILNTARQLGSSVGLAVVASVGIGVTSARWEASVSGLPEPSQAAAAGLTQDVNSGSAGEVAGSIGSAAGSYAQDAFLSGYRSAMLAAAVALGVAVFLAVLHLGQHPAQRSGAAE
jgi:MFS transporter, DHA2 family, methylenomycin A resistance protein